MQQKENEEYYITLIKNITFVGQLSTKGPIRAGPPRLHLFLGVLRAGPRRCPRGPSHVLLILSLQPAFLILCWFCGSDSSKLRRSMRKSPVSSFDRDEEKKDVGSSCW